MKHQRRKNQSRRRGFLRVVGVEGLETRTLLTAAETFTGPSLTDLIVLARQGKDTAPAAIERMLHVARRPSSRAGRWPTSVPARSTATASFRRCRASSRVTSRTWISSFRRSSPTSTSSLKLAGPGDRGRRDFAEPAKHGRVALELGSSHADAQTAIDSVTAGPILSLDTPLSGYAAATQDFRIEPRSPGAEPELVSGPARDSEPRSARRVDGQGRRPIGRCTRRARGDRILRCQAIVDAAVDDLESTASAIAQDDSSDAQSELSPARSARSTLLSSDRPACSVRAASSARRPRSIKASRPNLTIPQSPSAIDRRLGDGDRGRHCHT